MADEGFTVALDLDQLAQKISDYVNHLCSWGVPTEGKRKKAIELLHLILNELKELNAIISLASRFISDDDMGPNGGACFEPIERYCQMSWMSVELQAAIFVPSLKIAPATTAGSNVLPLSFRQWF